ncbi:solute carrier family 22 member 7 isoform X1 [Heterocephalus glaber]|uniref:Solute carrier family 22 member 7 n=1 Tax=Heterocephalus glaber TaxID=10181 RepID=A0AAX6PA24_HETGA|nr:solute carrier family 22 member 7 isoform X1 [Heterocephalus glaber]
MSGEGPGLGQPPGVGFWCRLPSSAHWPPTPESKDLYGEQAGPAGYCRGTAELGSMHFEELLDQVGGFGPFQLRNLVLMALPRILLPLHFLLPVFLAAVPSHHCALSGVPANISHQDLWLEAHVPREPDGTFSSCLRFAHPWALPNSTLGRAPQSLGELEGRASAVPCSEGWEYDSSEFSSTIATEWNLVCEHKGLNKVTSTLFFIGVLVGAVIFGYLSDRFGRRRLLLVAYVSSLVLGLASVASVNYIMFAITRTFTGLALAGFTVIVLPLELEWLDVEHRTVAGVLSTIFWSGGVTLLALVGYLIRDWRWLLLAVTLPLVLGIISIWWVPESARWLLTQGRVQEAQSYLLHCARLNGRSVGEDSLSMEALSKVAAAERVVRRPSYLDLFRTPRLRHISLCCMMVWFGVNFSYYGLTLDLSGLGLTVYQTQLLFGAVEVPSKLVVYLLVRYVGRRPTEVGMLVGAALTFGVRLLVPSETKSWRTALTVIGKAFSEASFTTAYLFTSELYPTVLRQTGLGLSSLVGRLGGSLAPLAALLDGVWLSLPNIAYGGIALLAACTALLLPETRRAQLPETIQDVERMSALPSVQEEEMQAQN